MTELKTLKNFVLDDVQDACDYPGALIRIADLKAEAVKIFNADIETLSNFTGMKLESHDKRIIQTLICKFHNITDKDLEEKKE